MFQAIRDAKIRRLFYRDTSPLGLVRSPLIPEERHQAHWFNGPRGELFAPIRLERVTGQVRVLSFQRTPSNFPMSSHLRYDALLGWGNHITHYDEMQRLMKTQPRHDYRNRNERAVRWSSESGVDVMCSNYSNDTYAHFFIPPSIDYKLTPGDVIDIDFYTVMVVIIDRNLRHHPTDVESVFSTTRRWGIDSRCPSVVPASIDLDGHADAIGALSDEDWRWYLYNADNSHRTARRA